MSVPRPSKEFHGKLIISMANGEIIGKVVDMLVDRDTLRVAAVVTSKGGFMRRGIKAIRGDKVKMWGQDVVLVAESDVIKPKDELIESEKWLKVSDQIKGHAVINTDGTRLGRVKDVVIDEQGHLVAYDLDRVAAKSPVIESGRIPAIFTHSLGPDVLIIDTTRGTQVEESAHSGATE